MVRRLSFFLLGSVLFVAHASAQAPAGALPRTIHAVRVAEPLRIDGRLDEEFYTRNPSTSDFVQVEPQEGAPATEKTEVWIAFDEDNVYISFRCWESQPERVVATEMRRDHGSMWRGDDIIYWMFDTFLDRRNGFEFGLNSIGGRQDAQMANERQWIGDWNTIWDFSVGRFADGWAAEAAIPFKSLRYRPGESQVWGFNALRTNRWKNELSFLSPTPQAQGQSGIHMASRAAHILGLTVPPGSKNLEIKPYAIASASGVRGATTPGLTDDLAAEVGADLKYGVTQNLTADLTFNTDFAQVEADQQQVNLTRFSLFFPEKREFFLENQGTFTFGAVQMTGQSAGGDTPILFYSRRIGLEGGRPVPIDVGGRMTGRVGRYSLGLLNIQTGDEAAAGARSTNFSVVRVKRDVLRRSSVGLLFTGRRDGQEGADNATYGVDATLAFFENLAINSYWARTASERVSGQDTSYRGQLDYNGDRYGVQAEHLLVGDHFNPGVGFVRRHDIRKSFGQFRFSPRGGTDGVVRKWWWIGSVNYVENGAGGLETREQIGEFLIDFQNADRFQVAYNRLYEFLPIPFRIAPDVTLPVGGYSFDNVRVTFARGAQQRVSGAVFVDYGTFYSGHKTTVGVTGGRLNVTPRISLEPNYSIDRVDLLQGAFTNHLAGARVTYTPTPLMFASAFVQYNSSNQAMSSNVRLRWEYRPGSELFVVYNEDRDTVARRFPDLTNRAFIVKVNRLLRF